MASLKIIPTLARQNRLIVQRRAFASAVPVDEEPPKKQVNLATRSGGVHGNWATSKSWRNKPLFRRQGDVRFKTGADAVNLLISEAKRRDAHEVEYINSVQSSFSCLSSLFDRNPRYAFLAKQMMEPERMLSFRVAWMDDSGVYRLSRGWRVQYNSALGPYEGALHFGHHVNAGVVKSLGFDSIFSNALTGFHVGAAVGGADINPFNKSEAEIQRFCQSYMTELSKYIGPDIDYPVMGMGVGEKEMGYLYGQYKRLTHTAARRGKPYMSGWDSNISKVSGYGIAHFAHNMLESKGDSLEGKRCLITGAGKVARSLAEKLLEYGAIPLTFSDESGFVYEPDGIDASKLRTLSQIKEERGAQVGRYIIASTSAKFNEPDSLYDIPCDLCFPCAGMSEITDVEANHLADNGCMGIIEGGHSTVTAGARKTLKKRGLLYGPHTVTLTGMTIVNGLGVNRFDEAADKELAGHMKRVHDDVAKTAREFNTRGDLYAGATILGFIQAADVMITQGAV
eukprot:CAMPEP_0116020740 /NCGR_PEP_ID=MMETSP0321-20121206/9977_1 /TAXON_ID=163516 /ORGANISM="Leptocylindrus danicus var. danicus, Strain B650" /LENGTH=509 /DNA_ID=CAMNT_0003491489 /DNA_START=78 /DNA_END=1607 /DNA_ORIENTATION=-